MKVGEIGVVVPARDEEARIGACLDALDVAARHPELAGIRTRLVVVLDDCTDGTGAVCRSRGVATVACPGRDVGRARARGVAALVADRPDAAGPDRGSLWLATTDADSRVAPDWLAMQVRLASSGADAVLGVVDIENPSAAFTVHYRDAARGQTRPHPHVHGASMGMSLEAYERVGGFAPAQVGEDQDLADRLDSDPAVVVVRSTAVRVATSERRTSRVRGGFADVLLALDTGRPVPDRSARDGAKA